MVAERALVDTNVLISAVDPDRRDHASALALLEGGHDLVVAPQVAREFLGACTRPIADNGLGHDPAVAAANLRELLSALAIVEEDEVVTHRLISFVGADRARGKQVHDAHLVATALRHGVTRIITSNRRHFERFADLIDVVPLS
ncbi:MAG: PIN domain-containing protein [Nocardioides sp.]|uniref:type II toxin-antitoxin system VapC family toxin n=1 Tax=Nocardioides sp. TaxID=35761 RepID=UPI0039E343E7